VLFLIVGIFMIGVVSSACPSGLVSYWDFDDVGAETSLYEDDSIVGYWKLDGTSGVVVDSSGNGNDGTVNGGVSRGVDGEFGNAFSFDGVDGFVEVGDAIDDLQSLSIGSISQWVKFNELGGTQIIWSASDSGDVRSYVALYVHDSDHRVFLTVYENNVEQYNIYFEGTTLIETNRWYHVVVVQDGIEPVLYMDNIKYNLGSDEPTPSSWFNTVNNIVV